ncbi:MAG: hypothetical protein AAF443_08765 [Chlamydiota bacterium]
MVVTISKRAPWNLGKQMLQIFPEPCEKCGLALERVQSLSCNFFVCCKIARNFSRMISSRE